MKTHNHILFKLSAKLLIAAIGLCVLFGNGTHLHSVFDHFSDHGDIHAYVHAHPADSDQNQAEEFDGKDDHQHVSATLELNGTLSQKIVEQDFTDENIFTDVGIFSTTHTTKEVTLFLVLPPPDFLVKSDHFYSFSLRGPPLG